MKAIEIAKTTQVAVLATTAEVKEEVEKPEEAAVVAQLQQAPVIAVKPSGEEVAVAEVVQTAPVTETLVAENTLPQTASASPLIALFGLLALGGAMTLRFVEKRAWQAGGLSVDQ